MAKIVKVIKRNWLKKQIELGKVEAKCEHHLTDDYRFDDSVNFGKTDWMQCRIRNPKFATRILDNGSEMPYCADDDFVWGQINLMDCDLHGKPGKAYLMDDDTIWLYVHSNLSYSLRMKA